MTLQQCRYLLEIEKHGSLTDAAKELFVTQPSITKAIKELEKELHITILNRSNRGVSFTKEGRELAAFAKILVEQADAVCAHFSCRQQTTPTCLTIASQHYNFVPPALAETIRELNGHPYELTLLEGKSTDVIRQTASGIASVGILYISSLNSTIVKRRLAEHALQFTQLAALPEHVFLRRSHPLAANTIIQFEQLSPYPYMTFRKNDVPLDIAESYFTNAAASQRIYIEDRATMNYILLHTNAYIIGTGCRSRNAIPTDICSIPLDVSRQLSIGYLQRKDIPLSDQDLRFIYHLQQALQGALP